MPDTFWQAFDVWPVVTHMGSASVLMPTVALAATGLWQSQQRVAVHTWLLALALAVLVTIVSKILFLGWGIGIASLDFTGVSGHTLLAASVLPVLFGWLLATEEDRPSVAGAAFGMLAALGVAASRVILGAHSVSEVVLACLLGITVSRATLAVMDGPARRPWFVRLSPLFFLLALGTPTSSYLPTHNWEIRIALFLSGNDEPYTRDHLKAPDENR